MQVSSEHFITTKFNVSKCSFTSPQLLYLQYVPACSFCAIPEVKGRYICTLHLHTFKVWKASMIGRQPAYLEIEPSNGSLNANLVTDCICMESYVHASTDKSQLYTCLCFFIPCIVL